MISFETSYNVYLSFVSLMCEISLSWCFIIFVIYVCFFYFNNICLNTQPLLCMLCFSFVLIYLVIINIIPMPSDLIGGIFHISYHDIVVRNIVVGLTSVLLCVIITNFINYCSMVSLVEYSVLIYILLISSMLVLYCNDIMSLFLFIELQSMVVYILICLRCNFSSTGMGIRYFILGTIVSLLFLFSFTLVYYITGISSFIDFIYVEYICSNYIMNIFIVFIYMLFLFKLYIFPFHFIGGDLYRNSPLYILLFISSVLYCVYVYIFIKIVIYSFILHYIVYILVLLTLIFGTLNVLMQRDLRSFLGFGTSVHSSLLLLMLFVENSANFSICMFYVLVYISSILGVLLCLYKVSHLNISGNICNHMNFKKLFSNSVFLRRSNINYCTLEHISSWAGLFKNYKFLVYVLSVFIWSMAGLPPFSGFFVKFCVLSVCFINSHGLIFAVLILISIITSLYYVRIIKEFYYVECTKYYFIHIDFVDCVVLTSVVYFCLISIFLPEFFIYIFY